MSTYSVRRHQLCCAHIREVIENASPLIRGQASELQVEDLGAGMVRGRKHYRHIKPRFRSKPSTCNNGGRYCDFGSVLRLMRILYFKHAHFISILLVRWVWEKRGAHELVHGDLQNGSFRYWNYLEDYWPCAGKLSAVPSVRNNCVPMHDPINSGLTRWRMAVWINKWTPRGNREEPRC